MVKNRINKDAHNNPLDKAITTKEGQEYEITLEGSLGLLAAGYKGILLWREKRKEYRKEKTQESGKNE